MHPTAKMPGMKAKPFDSAGGTGLAAMSSHNALQND